MRIALPKIFDDTRVLVRIWVIFIVMAIIFFFSLTGWSFFKLDALVIWIFSCLSIVVLSQKLESKRIFKKNWLIIIVGLFLVIFSFLNIPIGFGNPPYTIAEFSLFLSGINLVFFGVLGIKIFFLPASLPSIAVIGFQFYEKFNQYFKWFSEPLIPPILSSVNIFLKLINVNHVIENNNISYITSTGESVNLIISTDCTGIWSLGTFTITCIIILVSFPEARTKKSYFLILIGFLGTFITNLIRIFFIVFVGYHWGSIAAVKIAHDYFGWLLFSIWVIIFWYFFITRHLNISILEQIRDKSSKPQKEEP